MYRYLQLAVREREFVRCDYDGSGVLTPHEFAMHLLSFAPAASQAQFTDRAHSLKSVSHISAPITREDFNLFAELLLHLEDLQVT